jgi:hypothetical protein
MHIAMRWREQAALLRIDDIADNLGSGLADVNDKATSARAMGGMKRSRPRSTAAAARGP